MKAPFLYSPRAAERILRRLDGQIEALSARYAIPGAVIRAVLWQEITNIDLLDPLADCLVRLNWLRLRLFSGLTGRPMQMKKRPGNPFWKLDSSTGYAQIFAFVGVNALNFAMDRGLVPPGPRPDPDSAEDRRRVWMRLRRDGAYNLELAALNLLSAAEEKTGRLDFAAYSAEELKRIFTRYNGTSKEITPYGEACYRHYLRFAEEK